MVVHKITIRDPRPPSMHVIQIFLIQKALKKAPIIDPENFVFILKGPLMF